MESNLNPTQEAVYYNFLKSEEELGVGGKVHKMPFSWWKGDDLVNH